MDRDEVAFGIYTHTCACIHACTCIHTYIHTLYINGLWKDIDKVIQYSGLEYLELHNKTCCW
jgi:hypothetical protein